MGTKLKKRFEKSLYILGTKNSPFLLRILTLINYLPLTGMPHH
ncbi:hypothetical protein [Lacihabitans lacunae]|uniref:Uncharacterized protein n=1 Tax=Lacihabitans lacunae TaxID=1028214 RepID=A0ABV7YVA1_9BACT